jgi:hypothetical protein
MFGSKRKFNVLLDLDKVTDTLPGANQIEGIIIEAENRQEAERIVRNLFFKIENGELTLTAGPGMKSSVTKNSKAEKILSEAKEFEPEED